MHEALLSPSRPSTSPSGSRRRIGPLLLSALGLVALTRLRGTCESAWSIGAEALAEACLLFGVWAFQRRYNNSASKATASTNKLFVNQMVVLAMLIPWLVQSAMRMLGQGTGWELIMLSSFGWATCVGTVVANRPGAMGLSVICSGFLTLLVTCSSDQSTAVLVAFLWGAICLWWLASSHAKRVMQCQVSTVVESSWQRPVVVFAGCAVFALSAWSVSGRFPAPSKLPWEVAPTSGGTGANDSFARSGVGDGDALVAARENAASFGAVNSDLMLESKEASLFDLYSDTFGEPFRKEDVERTVALNQQEQETMQPANMAQSDGASAALTTQRRPGKPMKELSNRMSDALLFWIGRPDTHLALERYSNFDGLQWHRAHATETAQDRANEQSMAGKVIRPTVHRDTTWFSVRPDYQASSTHPRLFWGTSSEAVKIARLKSARIPTVAAMHSWHIQQVDDSTFFHVDGDDNLSMPSRNRIPEYTVIRYVNHEIDLESLTRAFEQHFLKEPPSNMRTRGVELARTTAHHWIDADKDRTRWEQVQGVLGRLKSEYRFCRERDTSSIEDPLADFFTSGEGNDLMFATAASTMLRELGYETRLVTGFVAKQENRLNWTKEYAVFAQDTHAWIELKEANGEWIALEPSPGFPVPAYRISWWYWIRLHAWSLSLVACTIVAVSVITFWQRAALFDCACQALAIALWFGNDRQLCRWLLFILDRRSRLAGRERPAHISPRRWYEFINASPKPAQQKTVVDSIHTFFREADQLWFGKQNALSPTAREACRILWTRTSCRMMREALRLANDTRVPNDTRVRSEAFK